MTLLYYGLSVGQLACYVFSTDNLILLLIAQCLHALSFGASHFAAMQIITEKVETSLSSTAQGIYSAFSMGIGMGAFVLLSGPLYSSLLGSTFYIMSAVSILGIVFLLLLKSTQMNKIFTNNLH